MSTALTAPEDADLGNREMLRRAMADANALMEFGVRSDKKVPDKILADIVNTRSALLAGRATAEQEIVFWNAFNELSTLLFPVTGESLRYVAEEPRGRNGLGLRRPASPALAVIRDMRAITFVFLALLVLVQIYWLIGSSIIRDAERLTGEYLTVRSEMSRVQAANPNVDPDHPLLKPLEIRESTLKARIDASYETLITWNSVWAWVISRPTAALQWLGLVPASNPPTLDSLAANSRAEQVGRFAQQSLTFYVLPLLYGLLGACTHILRRLNEQLERSTLTRSTHYRYRVRLTLGAVAGPAIGLFFTPERPPSLLAELSPFAIAFVAGYSVDVLFSAIDRFIRKTRDWLEDKPAAAAPAPAAAAAAPPVPSPQAAAAAAPARQIAAAAPAHSTP